MPWLEAFFGRRCPNCGGPLDQAGVCSACREALVPVRAYGAVFLARYPQVRGLVRAAKYRAHEGAARWAAERIAARVAQSDWPLFAVTYVPSFPWRAALRGSYLPQVLARAIAESLGLPMVPVLRRVRYSRSQTLRRRRRRLPQVFTGRGELRGSWLLVDDVYTTGATFRRAAEALIGAGAEVVFGAFLAVTEPERLKALPFRKV